MLRLLEYFKREKTREKIIPSFTRYIKKYGDNTFMMEDITFADRIMEMFDTPVKIKKLTKEDTYTNYFFIINDKIFKGIINEQSIPIYNDNGDFIKIMKGISIAFEQKVNDTFTFQGITNNLEYKEISQLFATLVEICKLHKNIEYYTVESDSSKKIGLYKKLLAKILPNNEITYAKDGYRHILEVYIKPKDKSILNSILTAFRNKFKDK